jgi:hypothetical protein
VQTDFHRRDAAPVGARQNRQRRDALLERVIALRGLRPFRPYRRHVETRLCDTATAPERGGPVSRGTWLAG